MEQEKIHWEDLMLRRHCDWNLSEEPGEPFTGAVAALANSAGCIAKAVGGIPFKWAKSIRRNEKRKQRQNAWRESQGQLQSNQIKCPESDCHATKNREARDEDGGSSGGISGNLPPKRQDEAKEHLPEPHTLPGEAGNNIEKHGTGHTSRMAKPSANYVPSTDEYTISDNESESSHNRPDQTLTQAIAKDTIQALKETTTLLA